MYRLWLVEQCCSWLIPLRNYHKKYTFENTKPTVKEIPLSLNLTRPFESKSKSNPKRREKKSAKLIYNFLRMRKMRWKLLVCLVVEREREREILGLEMEMSLVGHMVISIPIRILRSYNPKIQHP